MVTGSDETFRPPLRLGFAFQISSDKFAARVDFIDTRTDPSTDTMLDAF